MTVLDGSGTRTGTPTATVVVPAYNAAEWLPESIGSILSQTMRDFQLIIVDDCSTDSTPEAARRLAASDGRIEILRHDRNRGLSAARNSGIERARGRYVCFVDADDMIHPKALEMLCGREDESDVAICDFARGEALPALWDEDPKRGAESMSGREALRRILYQDGICNSVCTMAVSGQLLKETGLRFREGILYEDLEFVPRLMLAARSVRHFPLALYFYRINPQSIITTFNRRRLDVLTVTEGIERLLEAESVELRRAAADRRFSANYDMLLRMTADGGEEYRDEIRRCWRLITGRRSNELRDPNVRLKNKLGALLSYAGLPAVGALSKILRRR